jgi:hypothetical protein
MATADLDPGTLSRDDTRPRLRTPLSEVRSRTDRQGKTCASSCRGSEGRAPGGSSRPGCPGSWASARRPDTAGRPVPEDIQPGRRPPPCADQAARAAIPHLRNSAKSPAIVNVSSINALAALGSEPYSSAKARIGALTINLAASLAAEGIRVNTVAPATIRTRNWEGQEGGADRFRHLYPLGRVGEPEDVAAAVAFLASSDAAWITGHTLPVDGGLMTGARTA